MAPCFSPSSVHVVRVKRHAAWHNKNNIPLRKLPSRVMLYLLCAGKAALMSALSRPNTRGWSQWCLKEWDHFSIDCRVGQCKGHLMWQSGRCCLSACLPVYRPACLSAFILACLSACFCLCALSCLSFLPFQRDDEHNWGWSWFSLFFSYYFFYFPRTEETQYSIKLVK